MRLCGHRAEFLNWGFFEPRPWRNYLHTHSFFEVCYAYSGAGTFRIGDADHLVRQGDLFVAGPGDVHEIVSADEDPLGIYFWSYTLLPETHVSGGEDVRLLEAFASGRRRAVSGQSAPVASLLSLLDREAALRETGFETSVEALASALVLATARAVIDPPVVLSGTVLLPGADAAPGTREAALVRTVVRYLHDNYDRPVTVRDVAAQIHLSERHTSRLFRLATGTTIRSYLQRLRLDVAAQRLVESELSVKEVAHATGYPDVRHFTTVFKGQWGMTPALFRKRNGTRHL